MERVTPGALGLGVSDHREPGESRTAERGGWQSQVTVGHENYRKNL